MGCNCSGSENITNWIDWQNQQPQNPLDLIARVKIGGAVGSYINSTTFSTSTGTIITNPFVYNGTPTCSALGTDNLQRVADADQWNFSHLTRNSSATLAPPLTKVIFLRGGTNWEMSIPINFGGATYNDLQLSFRDNAGTRGDFAGTVPAITFQGLFTGSQTLAVTLKSFGRVSMGLRAIDLSANWSMFEMEWIIVR